MSVVVLLSPDLMTCSKAAGAASRAAVTLATVANLAGLREKCAAQRPRAVLVDLTAPGLDIAALVKEISGDLALGSPGSIEIIAFGPHVHDQKLAVAEQAGCTQVLSRGQFTAQAEQIFARFAAP